MKRSRSPRWLAAVALVASFVVLVLGHRTVSAQDGIRDRLERLQTVVGSTPLRLPAIRLDVAQDGRIEKINGFDAADIDSLWERMNGTPLVGRVRYFAADDGGRSYVEWFQESGIQHVTVASRQDGLFVLVNGGRLPHIQWDEERLANLLEVMENFEQDETEALGILGEEQMALLADVLPLVRSMNMRVDIRFPAPAGGWRARNPVPLPPESVFRMVNADAEVPRALQTVDVEVVYRPMEDGDGWIPSLFEFSTLDLQTLLAPFDIDVPLMRMPDDVRERLSAEGIESVGLQLSDEGLFVSMDDMALPHVAWDEESLTNLTAFLGQLYPDGEPLPDDAAWVPVVRSTAPMYNDLALSVMFRFPSEDAARAW